MFDRQSQTGGEGSVNQHADRGGINQNAKRDIYNLFTTPEIDFGIIEDIFNYIFSQKIKSVDVTSLQDSRPVLDLKLKVDRNFLQPDEKKEISAILTKNWERMRIVEKFIQEKMQISSEDIDALVLMVRSLYCEKRSCSCSEEKVENVSVLADIARDFVPTVKSGDPNYYANALAIILYLFQMCEIGERTEKEDTPLTLF